MVLRSLFICRATLPEGFFEGACDMHSHLLPGVDDGFPTVEKTLEGLALMERYGFKKLKMTPHFMKDYPQNTKPDIEEKFKAFCQDHGNNVGVELSLGGEYMLDSCFLDRCAEGFLTLDKERTLVLCETSYMMADPRMKEMIYEVMLKGYQPVMAHPERYNYASMPLYKRWKEKDYLFQLNLLSLAGAYGDPAKMKARDLLNEGMYDYVGSDLHRIENVDRMISDIRLSTKETDRLLQLFENNKQLD